ncbi:nucleotidyltransferase family protein [Eubacteriales bacterium OttesenSCG-928-A19]|nr:nucleotidyltransferase family protein [Eubacteriales bacterium OttesenSCG-928-A19]
MKRGSMRVCGIICEYNPFHNGHAYLIRALKERTGCAYVVCAMSGQFTQRGEAALVSKWARAEMALRSGADAVFELPALFAVRDAERFARGGVALLSSLGVVTHLGFGSESGDLDALLAMAKVEGDLNVIRANMARGMTLARARGEALGQDAGAPNDTLAVEYLRALGRQRAAIEPVTVKRLGGGYHDETLGGMASATAVRAAIYRGEDVYAAMPAPAYALLLRLKEAGAYQRPDGLDEALLALLRTIPAESLARIADVGEGLENRISRAAQDAVSRASLLELVKCKRYTWSRLSRVLTQALVGMTKQLAMAYPVPTYARLLGFRRDAQPLMAAIRRQADIPIVTRAAKYRPEDDRVLALDIRAGDLWALGMLNPPLRKGRADLTHDVVIVD